MPHTIQRRHRRSRVVYCYYRCRSTAGGRPPCGCIISARAIEAAVADALYLDFGQPGVWDEIQRSVQSITYDHVEGKVRMKLFPVATESEVEDDASDLGTGALNGDPV